MDTSEHGWRPDDWNTAYYAAFVRWFPVKARTTAEAARDWQCFEAGADAMLKALRESNLLENLPWNTKDAMGMLVFIPGDEERDATG